MVRQVREETAGGRFAIGPAIASGLAVLLGILVAADLRAGTGITTRVSVDNAGNPGNASSAYHAISADGRYVVFGSWATNLVPGSGYAGIYVRDRQTGQTTRVSVDSAGNEANDQSFYPSISADGRYVLFESMAGNLVAGDNNNVPDMFVHDRQTGQTTRVSVGSAGEQGNDGSFPGVISADGRYVAFQSYASSLVPGDNNAAGDIFVHDRQTGETTRISVDSAGGEGKGQSQGPSISADGRYVAFASQASNLVPGDNNATFDVFVHDRQTGETTRVSVDSAGNEGNGSSINAAISADGRHVAFESSASNLVAGDTNGFADIFVHDRQTGQTTRVSVDSAGNQGDSGSGYSSTSSISADGRYVAFDSGATNLVAGDNNAASDVFVHDRQTGRTNRASVNSAGNEGNDWSGSGSISADGRFVAFGSVATNLAPGVGYGDVYVRRLPWAMAGAGDFDGDGRADFAVWRSSDGTWYAKQSSDDSAAVTQWGDLAAGDIPVPGDYDGDGKVDAAVWRRQNGTWYVKPSSGNAPMVVQWGDEIVGDKPVPEDYDGDGKFDLAVWRASSGTWYVKPSSGIAPMVVQWGDQTAWDVPVPGDYDADGRADFAVWRASNGTWYVKPSSGAAPTVAQWGDEMAGDKPVPGDYDGDGKADLAVWRAQNGTWYVKPSSGIAPIVAQWGDQAAGDIPVAGDYDGDGKADIAVWRSQNGTWYVKPSSGIAPTVTPWGDEISGDRPVNRPVHLWGNP